MGEASQDKSAAKNRFGAFAVSMGFVTEAELAECVEDQLRSIRDSGKSKRLGELLIEKSYMTSEQIREVLLAQQQATGSHKIVGGYEIISKIGAGGMGAVYKARQVSLDRMVALKVLPPKFAEDTAFIERFQREARAAAALNHVNIIQGIDVGFADGYHYFAMELVEGESLSVRMKRDGPLKEIDALRIAEEMASALSHAHSRGLVHRDIKPANILIGTDGVSKLADLGLARRTIDDASVTQAGKAIGTPYYISPEQALGEEKIDIRADIYSLGATLFHAVTGRPAFDGPSPAVVMTKHLTDPVPSAREASPEISAGFDKVIRKMMAKDRSERYQTPDELLDDIRRLRSRGRSRSPTAKTQPAEASAVSSETRPLKARTSSTKAAPAAKRTIPLPVLVAVAVAVILIGLLLLLSGMGSGKVPQGPGGKSTVHGSRTQGQAVTIPGPPGTTPTVVDDGREKALQEMYDYALRFVREHPDDPAGAIGHFEKVCEQGKGTKFSLMASGEIEKLRTALAAKAQATLDERKAAADALAAEGRFGEALAALGTAPPELAGSGLEQKLADLAQGYMRTASRRYVDIERSARALAASGKFDEAEKAFAPAKSFGIPALDARVARELASIAAARKAREEEAQSRAAADAVKELDSVLDGFWTSLSKREYEAARARLRSVLSDMTKSAIHAELRRCEEDLARIDALWKAASEGLSGQVGQKVTLKVGGTERTGTLRAGSEGRLVLVTRAGGGEMQLPVQVDRLEAEDVAASSGYEAPDAGKRLALAVFFLGELRLARAKTELENAKSLGADVSRYDERIAVVERGREEVSADKALAELRALVAGKKWDEASKALEAFKARFAATKAAKAAEEELLRIGGAVEDGLLEAGKVDLFKDFTLPEVFFLDSLNGNDSNDGKKWSTAWKTFDKVFSSRDVPPEGGKAVVLLRGRGSQSPYLSPRDPMGNSAVSFTGYRSNPGTRVDIIGVDDTGEVVLAPRPEAVAPGANKIVIMRSGTANGSNINLRFEGFQSCLQSNMPPGTHWIGCRFCLPVGNPLFSSGTLNMSRNLPVPVGPADERVVRDCLFVGGGGVTFGFTTKGRVEHCTFVNCLMRGFGEFWHGAGATFDGSTFSVSDCLFSDMDRAFNFCPGCTPAVVTNCYIAKVRNMGEPRIAAEVKAVPDAMFANPAAGDYSLSPKSPLRGKASDGADVGFRPRECLKAAMDAVAKLQMEYNSRQRRPQN